MNTTKMSLANIQGKLSRTEMKNIMADSGTVVVQKRCACVGSNTSFLIPCFENVTTCGSAGFACNTTNCRCYNLSLSTD